MLPTRRFLAGNACLAASLGSVAAILGSGPALGQGVPAATALDARARLLLARDALPGAGMAAAGQHARTAAARSLEWLDDGGVDLSAGRTVLVNVAAAELIAYQDGQEVLRSRVIVGAARTRTPQLATFVTSVRCNPPWYVPASIEPEIRAAGAVGFRTINGRLVQPPGPNNPLGAIRIGLQDSDGIFLHGTSSPGLFARQDRALSHGCVRVERISDLAAWLLDAPPAQLRAAVASGRTTELIPPRDAQVALAYLTAWPGAGGRVAVYPDPYGLDQPGSRRAPFRRVARPVPALPTDPEAAAAAAEDDPL